ncbi:MAG TPA: VanZ family protein [Thermoanaerobaculia bacterium]|jgi:glycopeptide antibiotics resistance protein|nr:VanZ family protein [Thermoanaerobaculia bacterium]
MGKREVRVIVVRKYMTVALLVLVSALMAALLFYLSGKAYTNEDDEPLTQLLLRTMHRQAPITRDALLAGLMPVIANMLFFVPWGFLVFLFFDSPKRPRSRTYLITVLAGAIFAAAMEIWQSLLPTRVIGVFDVLSNTLGALAGAIAGHVRKRVRVQFDY